MRTSYCGALTAEDVGATVVLCGWVASRREHGEHLAFVDLRDHTGVVQCVVGHAHDLRSEYVLRVSGTVRARPPGTENPSLATGAVEVGDCQVEVLSTAEPAPFPVTDRTEADEAVRLRYRYVDLRRDRMQRNLRLRARVNAALRRSMEDQGFVEVETPMLIGSTPEGARDFVVPSRLQPGSFYALPQSPQLFKQLCMVGGFDRYYQIARCLRDEDLRADRQFEFMQLDAEASFVDQEDVMAFISRAVAGATEVATGATVPEIGRMTWAEAMERFGTDKPDLRFGMELVDLTSVYEKTEFNAFRAPCVKGIRVAAGAEFSRARLDRLTDEAKRYGAKGLVWMRVGEGRALDSPVARFLCEEELSTTALALAAEPGDLLLLVADERATVCHVLGLLRVELGRPPVNEGGFQFLWITAFPMFEGKGDDGRPIPAHHPFTMPDPEDLVRLEDDPMSVRSLAYDLVLNGWELGSGSVRIHRPDVQRRVFSLLGLDAAEAQARFGFLLDAFRYGAPPHAGFAFGIDRLVAILAHEETIREVVAFPKTQSGADPLTGAPSPLDGRQLRELGLRVPPPPSASSA
ncbi:MAG: aspartate--tRNA ligase [Actinomycetota bacterium]|nr:aspartate--tRNA ligase [Actinomycetota bacterium]MDQ3573703.1 aspartate--tRNA ligase [Actinomycetota bacterium]